MSTKVLKGNEITQDILTRLALLESILICRFCEGSGKITHRHLGVVKCTQCEGTGNRLDAAEMRT